MQRVATIRKRDISIFVISALVFFALSLPFREYLSISAVSEVRLTAMLNPILGMLYGWPAALGCAVANLFADIVSSYSLSVVLLGFCAQLLYGIIPYYLWKAAVPSTAHRMRLDRPFKVVLFILVIAVDVIFIGAAVLFFEYLETGRFVFGVGLFAALNDLDICVILGMPFLVLVDYYHSKVTHANKRQLSANEKVIAASTAVQAVTLVALIVFEYLSCAELSTMEKWMDIYSVSAICFNAIVVASLLAMFAIRWHLIKTAELKVVQKRNGTIFVDRKNCMEYLSMPGREQEFRVKADHLGITNKDVRKTRGRASYSTAWYTMISNQKGCPMRCSFCDCPGYGFYGNISREEFVSQIENIINTVGVTETGYFEVNFMRMGEPSLNPALLEFIEKDLKRVVDSKIDADIIYPYISTMLPKNYKKTQEFLSEFCRIKNKVYEGMAGIQFSITSTDEEERVAMFGNRSLSIPQIAELAKTMPIPLGPKYALNFAVTKDSAIDSHYIDSLFDKDKFMIKITPMHETFNVQDNGFSITTEYDSYDVFATFEDSFRELGWDVIVYLDSREEDEDDLTCGKLLLSYE